MDFCPKCGKDLEFNASFCSRCGTNVKNVDSNKSGRLPEDRHDPVLQKRIPSDENVRLPRKPDGSVIYGKKSVGIAVLLSIFIPGAGTIYAGKIGRGLMWMIISYILLFLLIGLFVWAWSVYDAYAVSKEHNALWYEYLENRDRV